ncbi:hypothetical protein V4S86_14270, partial [Citrobacter freundii]
GSGGQSQSQQKTSLSVPANRPIELTKLSFNISPRWVDILFLHSSATSVSTSGASILVETAVRCATKKVEFHHV